MKVDADFELFDLFAGSVLPFGGGVVVLSNVYFDESGTHSGSRLMSLAGYWFDKDQAARFSRDWAKELRRAGISHAHMTDCANGYGEYRSLSKPVRVKIQTLLSENIKRRSRFGFGVCMSPILYNKYMKGISGAPSAYTFCLMLCMNKVAEFASAIGYEGKLGYFFESGHADSSEANKFMSHIPSMGSGMMDSYRYAGHGFVDKRIALPLQAADMFAWHLRHYYDRCIDGHFTPRKDYVALHRKFDFQTLVEEHHIQALQESYLVFGKIMQSGQMEEALRAGDAIMAKYGLSQLPIWIPRNTRIGRTGKSDKPTLRY